MFAKGFARPGRESLLRWIPGNFPVISESRTLRIVATEPRKCAWEKGKKLFKLQV